MAGNAANLLKGGKRGHRGGSGRPKDAVRQACSKAFEERIQILCKIADNRRTPAETKIRAICALGKFGGHEVKQLEAELHHDGKVTAQVVMLPPLEKVE